MAEEKRGVSRRDALTAMGAWSAAAAMAGDAEAAGQDQGKAGRAVAAKAAAGTHDEFLRELAALVNSTPMVDTHEHLPEEDVRLRGEWVPCDDWGVLFSHYLNSDLIAAGMPDEELARLLSREVEPAGKWKILAPYWPAVKNTGFARATRIAIRELYGIDELNVQTVRRLQAGYESLRKPGLYRRVLTEVGGIESCQVDGFGPYRESRQPQLMMQDMNVNGLHIGPDVENLAGPTGISVGELADWHTVIRWWFDKYGRYATAIKSPAAYGRGLDYQKVEAEQVEDVFRRVLEEGQVSAEERKRLGDHLFWYVVEQAVKHNLPVKLHTGYYYGNGYMPLERVAGNPAQAAGLCRLGPDVQWVFMHIAYPYWHDLLAVAKHYRNAHIDMCWAWIIDPVASTQFLKSHLVTAPANKVFVFGGDYIPVECIVGHARMARKGVTRALGELVDEDYISRSDALGLVEPLLRGNAHELYNLKVKSERLRGAPWA
ncbi:MAG: amidohydrolase family protein [Phycisphaerales bacterium]|nr:MAG: amidohydrolase family protein [Phycisphaerales bacterium]